MRVAVVDQGSSSTKGALVADGGEILDRAEIPISVRRDGLRVEHDPEEIGDSVERVLSRFADRGGIDAVGLACQRSTCLLWDRETGDPITPALSWRDRRTADELGSWPEEARRQVARRTGLRLSSHYAGSKLAWLLDRTTGARRRAESGELTAGTLDAHLVRRLTGTDGTEPGQAGRTLLYDLEEDRWSRWLADRFRIPPGSLPELGPSRRAWGRWRGIPFRVVLGDQQAALVGHGDDVEEGTVVVHFGTGAFVLAATGSRRIRHEDLLTSVIWSDEQERLFQLEGSVNSAGSAVAWISDLVGLDLEAWNPRRFAIEDLPLCVPALSGLGSPWWSAGTRGLLSGLEEGTTAEDLVSGVVAGVVLRVIDNLEEMEDAGIPIGRIRVSGRLSRLPALTRFLADASGHRVERVRERESGLVGLARLLGVVDPATVERRVEPSWPPARRRRIRETWKGLVVLARRASSSPERA